MIEELELEAEPRAPLWIGAVRITDPAGDPYLIDLGYVLASVSIRHGKDSVDGGVQAATATLAFRAIPRAELKLWTVGSTLTVDDTASRRLFTGTITDSTVTDDDPRTDAVLTVIATSTLELAGRRQVAGHAWPAEGWGARVARILSEANLTGSVQAPSPDVPIAATKPEEGSTTYASMDALQALNAALDDVAGTAFELGDGSIVVQAYEGRQGRYPLLTLDPSLVLFSPDWHQVLDVKNRIVMGYGYGAGSVTVDEPDSQARYGLRWTGLFDSGLADAATANSRALDWLDRNAWPRWELSSVTLLAPQALNVGQLVELTELPASAPFAAWNAVIEGWTDTLEGPDWTQEVVLSDPIESGLALPWQDVPPTIRWTDVVPTCRWADAYNLANFVPE